MVGEALMTETLARFLGLYMLAAGIGLALNGAALPKMLEEMRQSTFAFYLGGLIAFAIGATIVGLHNDFSSGLAIVVSLIGWVSLAEGVVMLALPDEMRNFAGKIVGLMGSARIWGFAVAAIGALLIVLGSV